MAVEYAFGKIVTDGLVFAVDIADPNSYVTGSTTWRDISSTQSTGTLSGSVTYSSSNQGSLGFAGAGAVLFPEASALNTQTPSVEVWIKTNATTQNGFWFEKGTVNSQYSLFQEGASITWRQNLSGGLSSQIATAATFISTANWAHIVGTYTSGDRKIYINGVVRASDAQSGTVLTNTNGMSIGVFGGFNGSRGYYYNGSIAIVRVYNRVLALTEIQQNYNAQKSRFEL
jgi:hypothetical protein